jgi:L-2-hydroxyglutarate oxidase LhgO
MEIDITIVGAGVVGLAVAYELSEDYKDIVILEKNNSFGQETSSRNSEVIHAGIYYPRDSLKTKTCIEGKVLLYEFCRKYNINHRRIEKLIVAIDGDEIQDIENLYKKGKANGVDDLRIISRDEVKKIEPDVESKGAVYSPSTGILDTHQFMKNLAWKLNDRGGQIAYETELIGIDKVKDGFKVRAINKREGEFYLQTRLLINCAGLNSDRVALMAGIEDKDYHIKYCKGDYFRVSSAKAKHINRLIYPVPKEKRAGLGIHATLDLSGSLRLGPDDEYVDKIYYDIAPEKAKVFYESVCRFLPFIELKDLSADTAGVRPKLQGPDDDFRDFLIKEESDKGLYGLINLVGIESPGLTASLSIARLVKDIVSKL